MMALLPLDTILCSIRKNNCCFFTLTNCSTFWPNSGFFRTKFSPQIHMYNTKILMKCTFLQVMTAMLPCDTMLCSIRKIMDLGSFNLNKWTRLSQPTQWETCHLSPFTNSAFKLLMTLDPLVGQLTRTWPRPCPVHLQVCTYPLEAS